MNAYFVIRKGLHFQCNIKISESQPTCMCRCTYTYTCPIVNIFFMDSLLCQKSHSGWGLYHRFRNAMLSHSFELVTLNIIIKCLVHDEVYSTLWCCLHVIFMQSFTYL